MLINSFLDYLRYERNYSGCTIDAYSKDLRQFESYVKTRKEDRFDLGEIDADLVRSWIVCLMDKGMAPASVNRKLSSLKSFFKFLMKRSIVSANPLRLVTGPKLKKTLPYFVKEKDMVSLLDGDGFNENFEGVRNRLIVEMLYDTGIRRAELVGIRDSDVDCDMMQVRVTGKRNKQRLIPFAGILSDLIRMYVDIRNREIGAGNGYFFVRKTGDKLSVSTVYDVVRKALSGIPTLAKRSPHVLRHSFATSMMNEGAELRAVKELLGHSSLASTSVYTHTTFEELKKMYHAHPRAKKKEVINYGSENSGNPF